MRKSMLGRSKRFKLVQENARLEEKEKGWEQDKAELSQLREKTEALSQLRAENARLKGSDEKKTELEGASPELRIEEARLNGEVTGLINADGILINTNAYLRGQKTNSEPAMGTSVSRSLHLRKGTQPVLKRMPLTMHRSPISARGMKT